MVCYYMYIVLLFLMAKKCILVVVSVSPSASKSSSSITFCFMVTRFARYDYQASVLVKFYIRPVNLPEIQI